MEALCNSDKTMEFKSVLVKRAQRGGRSSKTAKSELAYNTIKGHVRKDGTSTLACVFYIGMDILKQARMIVGDRAEVLKSGCGSHGLIKRVHDGGVKVGMNGSARNCAKISFTKTDEMPLVKSRMSVKNVVITEDGILFDWPGWEAR